MTRNDEVADRLEELADLLEADDVDYKPRAYRRAAENVRGADVDVAAVATSEGATPLQEIDRVGEAIAAKIVEYVETGEIEALEEMREAYPIDVGAITRVEGVGPKTAGKLYRALDVRDLDDLAAAAEAGEIREIDGFGPKTEENILENVDFAREAAERELLGEARPYGEGVADHLRDAPAAEEVALAGSLRRWCPTIGDVDVLVASESPTDVVDAFTDWPEAASVIEAGETKASVRAGGVRVDLRVVVPDEFGSALQYFTGSKEHNVAVRNRAIERDLKVNEYGTFDVSDVATGGGAAEADDQRVGTRVAGDTEASMYEALDLAWIPPELRENRGEIEAAAADDLPDLVESGDVRGDLHTHTEWSDGRNTIAELVEGAAAFGHEYLAITDHATGPGMVGGVGLSDEDLGAQIDAVRDVAAEAPIDVFTGVEANVAADGTLSVADDVLAELDVVVASPHAALDGDGTDRLVAAASHPEVDVVGHPTGRQLNQRPGLEVDVERLASVAAEHRTALEVNANPQRLDLDGSDVKTAVDAGATIVVDTDAHGPDAFSFLRYGVHTARRGWATADDVLNARVAAGVRDFLAD